MKSMKREIKFRGRDIGGNWHYGNYTNVTSGRHIGHFISNSKGLPLAFQVAEESVGQYTGLKDRNGKEIYEGDILDCSAGEPDTVVFYNGCFRLRRRTVTIDKYENELDQELQVVGNIYEHHNLLIK